VRDTQEMCLRGYSRNAQKRPGRLDKRCLSTNSELLVVTD
jgi:hypothetical protein